ncbi:MAG: Rieske 2Fe-2S domain-containing protein [Planctomycetota bacterium]|nr:Rieske 2Fe-2S domain-containing protein [Planctomycetota bacterium]
MNASSVPDSGDGASSASPADDATRRSFLATTTMLCGLAGGYGMFGSLAARYLFPAHGTPKQWLFVARLADFAAGQTMAWETPTGQKVSITRQGDAGVVDDFIALSSVCPHLGCQVHWEQPKQRFFCPCHNGAFNPQGVATEGPPADSHQSLARFPLQIENDLLFIEVPVV